MRWYKHIAHFGDASKAWAAPVKTEHHQAHKEEVHKEETHKEAPKDDDDFDLFSGKTDEEIAAEEAHKKSDKPKQGPIGRSSVVLEVKPWEAETGTF